MKKYYCNYQTIIEKLKYTNITVTKTKWYILDENKKLIKSTNEDEEIKSLILYSL